MPSRDYEEFIAVFEARGLLQRAAGFLWIVPKPKSK